MPTATFSEIFNGLLFRSSCECAYKIKFVVLPVPKIIGGTQKMWTVPGYAHAAFSPKFLMGFCSGGGSYSDKCYSDSSYSDRRYSDKCYSDKYACSETSWSAHLCRKRHSLFYAEFGAEFTSLSTSLAVLVFVYWLFSYNWTDNCIIN